MKRIVLRSVAVAGAVTVACGIAVGSPGFSLAAPNGPDPGGSTVLTLDPAFAPLPNDWLQGALFAAPNFKKKVQYTNIPGKANVQQGAANLDNALHTTSGLIIVLGHSEGSEVVDYWLRRYGPSSDINPTMVSFVLTGDPESKYNGCMQVRAFDDANAKECPNFLYASTGDFTGEMAGPGFPADTRYKVKVIARQYDYYADVPANWTNDPNSPSYTASVAARDNRNSANSVGGKGQFKAVHLDYSQVNVNAPAAQTFAEGNATYVLGSPATYYLPTIVQEVKSAPQKQAEDLAMRPTVESVYGRKMAAPAPPSS